MEIVFDEDHGETFLTSPSKKTYKEQSKFSTWWLPKLSEKATEVKDDIEAERIVAYLKSINALLEGTPFKLGYRAANEALLYVSAAHLFDSDTEVETALDEFTLMKILSRIEGDKRSIGGLLVELQNVITSDYPQSNKKLIKMADTLKDKQFVSYWT